MNIVVEASIGVGKSTLLKNVTEILKKDYKLDVICVPEPIKKWTETPVGDILRLFASEPKRYAFLTQVLIMTTLNEQRKHLPKATVTIFERSIDSAKDIFQKTLEQDGILSSIESHTLQELNSTLQSTKPKADAIIYLQAEPELAFERSRIRAREGEKPLTIDYFKKLHTNYENMIEFTKIEILKLDAKLNPLQLAAQAADWINNKVATKKNK